MDESEGGVGFGEGRNSSEQFHRNEAISAVADDGFLGEEEDDYEDLYNDVNVGEGFLQSLRKNHDLGVVRNEEAEKTVEVPQPMPPHPMPQQPLVETGAPVPSGGGGTGGGRMFEKDGGGFRVTGIVDGHQNVGFRVNEMVGRGPVGGSGPPGGGGPRIELGQSLGKVAELEDQSANNSVLSQGIGQQPHSVAVGTIGNVGDMRNLGNDVMVRPGGGNVNGVGGNGYGNGTNAMAGGVGGSVVGGGSGGGGGGTILFVGDLHWWTTDAELELELCKYGPVKEVKFFDEKASGKSKGYCQVEFYDPGAATACKGGMNGHLFNGRPCVVAYASQYSVKRMGEAQVNRNQQMAQASVAQPRRGTGDASAKTGGSNIATGGNYQGGNYQVSGENNRGGYGRGNWGRGNGPGMGGRGPDPMRNRGGGMGGRGIMGNGGNGFGQGINAAPPMLHPAMFDPAFGAPMGRMGNYGGFPGAPTPPFPGILSTFPHVGNVGLPGVSAHVNPVFFGRGMPMNGMGMIPATGLDGHNMGMWSDPNVGGWAGDEHGGRAGESSYGEEVASDHQYGEVSHDRGAWPNAAKEKDRGSERDWSSSSDRRYRDDRDPGVDKEMPRENDIVHDNDWSERRHHDDRDVGRERERDRERSRDHDRDRDRERDKDRHRDDRDRHAEHPRHRERGPEYDDEWDRGQSSRTHSKSRLSQEEELRSRSRDAEYGKRRRLTSE